MMSGILASMGSDSGLSSFWSKPLPKPMVTYHPFHPCKKVLWNLNQGMIICMWDIAFENVPCTLQNLDHFFFFWGGGGGGGCLNIKMWYQYRDSHYKDKMFSWPAYLYNGNTLTWKDCLYNKMGPWPQCVKKLYFTPSIKIRWDNVVIAGQLVWKHHILYPLQWLHKHHMNVIESHIMGNSTACSRAYLDSQQRKKSALLVLCEGNPLVTSGFPSQRASNTGGFPSQRASNTGGFPSQRASNTGGFPSQRASNDWWIPLTKGQ